MNFERLAQKRRYPHTGSQTSIGILKDDLHLPSKVFEPCFGKPHEVLSLEQDITLGRTEELQHAARDSAFTASAFSY